MYCLLSRSFCFQYHARAGPDGVDPGVIKCAVARWAKTTRRGSASVDGASHPERCAWPGGVRLKTVTSRDEAGVPWLVDRRLERATSSMAATSLLPVTAQDGLEGLGFRPIGDVGGAYVTPVRPHRGYGRCAQRDSEGRWIEGLRVVTQRADRGPYSGGPASTFEHVSFDGKVALLRKGWDAALGRLLAECVALEGDGVVGVQLRELRRGQQLEFTALGTAVRYLGSNHLQQPFSTTLSGYEVAKLARAGYFPAAVVVAIAVGIRHNDYETVSTMRSLLTNREVPAHTELLNAAKRAARDDMASRAAALGADGALVDGEFAVDVLEGECDYAAEVRIIANAVARLRQTEPLGALKTIVDLSTAR